MKDNKIHKLMASVILIEAILGELDDKHLRFVDACQKFDNLSAVVIDAFEQLQIYEQSIVSMALGFSSGDYEPSKIRTTSEIVSVHSVYCLSEIKEILHFALVGLAHRIINLPQEGVLKDEYEFY